jgi:hypothetical protein
VTGTRLAQSYTSNGNATTKVSAYLKVLGTAAPVPVSSDAVIDATNFSVLKNGGQQHAVFSDAGSDFTGPGYLSVVGEPAVTGLAWSQLTANQWVFMTAGQWSALSVDPVAIITSGGCHVSYAVEAEPEGLYHFWMRVKAAAPSDLSMFVGYDDSTFAYFSKPLTTSWTWVKFDFVITDNKKHKITLTPLTGNFQIDQIYITASNNTPVGALAYTTPSYCTIHARIFDVDGRGAPTTPKPQYSAYSTIEDVKCDDWYNFSVTPFNTTDRANIETLVLNSVGATPTHNVSWEMADAKTRGYFKSLSGGAWTDFSNSLALRAYSDAVGADGNCGLSTPPARLEPKDIEDFLIEDFLPVFDNTDTVPHGTGNAVEIKFGDRIVTFIVDQSGSMTWEDRDGVRHKVSRDILDRLNSAYPGDVKYNLLKIGASPVFPVVVPLLTKVVSNDFSEIIREAFLPSSENFSGYRVLRKVGGFSNTEIDGEEVGEDGYRVAARDTDLTENTEYFYTVYTFDPAGRYSRGVKIKATPRERVIPTGIASFGGRAVSGSGVRIDANTVGLWHMDEGSGDRLFDFSKSEASFTITGSQYTWLTTDVPAGESGLRLDGLHATLVSDSSATPPLGNSGRPLTFMGWVKPYLSTGKEAIFSRSINGHVSFAVYRNGLDLCFTTSTNPLQVATAIGALHANEWNHIAIAFDGNGLAQFYINGVWHTLGVFLIDNSYSGAAPFNIGWDSNLSLGRFFGAITEFSLHDTFRDGNYIHDAYLIGAGDNGDRNVLLNFTIPDDYDFAGGAVRIVVNKKRPPFHEEDGDAVYDVPASPGNYTINVYNEYDLTYTYYYRIFSRNALGNWSDIEDSALVQVVIPDVPRQEAITDPFDSTLGTGGGNEGPGHGHTPAPAITVARSGNEKTYLKWDVLAHPETHRIRVYADAVTTTGDITYPFVYKGNIQGRLIFDGLPEDFDFVHRNLVNGQVHYYAVVTIDKYTRFSDLSLARIAAEPGDYLSDSGIPLHEPLNVRYRITDHDRVMISWDSPFTVNNSAQGYFDDQVFFYAGFLDYTGIPVKIDHPEDLNIQTKISNAVVRSIEDGFGLGGDPSTISTLPKVTFHVNPGGMILGTLRLTNHPILSIVDEISFDLNITYAVGSQFSYQMPSTTVTLRNPLSLELLNRDQSYAPPDCSGSPPVKRDGGYVRRSLPFVIRSQFAFKGTPIPAAKVSVVIYDATDQDLSDDNCSALPNLTRISQVIQLVTDNITNQRQDTEVLDSEGNPTGTVISRTYADLPVTAPQLPAKAVAFVMVTYGGFVTVRKMNLWFLNTLRIKLSAFAPTPNGFDVREEFANVWLIDPDHPNDSSKNRIVPDGTLVQWEIKQTDVDGTGESPSKRPFYSLDNVPLKGIWSRTHDGTARNVYFGPAQNIVADEFYNITASVAFDGLSNSDTEQLIFQAPQEGSYGGNVDPKAPRFLMEFPETENLVWSDGEDYAKLTISRNPLTATTRFQPCFITCAVNPIPFKKGTVVHIDAKGWTMYYGDVFEETDPYTGITTLADGNATISVDAADVTLFDDYTHVYFRKLAFVKNNANTGSHFAGPCNSCPTDDAMFNVPATIVSGTSKVIFNGKPTQMFGGGGADGIPVTVLVAREPFQLKLIGVRANGTFVNRIALDGVTSHEVIVEMSWKGGPVPDGTPLKVTTVVNGDKKIELPKTTQTKAIIDNGINPGGPARSFATLVIPPISPDTSFNAGVMFEGNYNAIGQIDRTRRVAITFSFIINSPPSGLPPSAVITKDLSRIDTISCNTVTLSPLARARAGFSLESDCVHLYAAGGSDGSIIHRSLEIYNIAEDKWTDGPPMSLGRVFQQSVRVGRYIYQMGGLVVDPATGALAISKTVERYDTLTDSWLTMAEMPDPVAYGVAQYVSGKIHVLCGYNSLQTDLNERVLTYTIASNTWQRSAAFTDAQLALFRRVSPFAFTHNGIIHVSGGLYHTDGSQSTDENGNDSTSQPVTIYQTTAFSFDPATGLVADTSNQYRTLPTPRHRGAVASFGEQRYFIGGANATSNSLRTMELINSSSVPFNYTPSSCKMIPGRSAFGAVTDDCSYSNHIYVCGGITSGRGDGFLKMTVVPTPASVRLQGTQSAAVNVLLADENGDAPAAVKVRVQGFLGAGGAADLNSIGSPSLIRTDEIIVHNGKGVATLFPRSDDFTTFDGNKVSMHVGSLRSYVVAVRATVIDEFYEGESELTNPPPPVVQPDNAPDDRQPDRIDFGADVDIRDYGTTQVVQSVPDGGVLIDTGEGTFSLAPTPLAQGASANVTYYSDFQWIPGVENLIDNNGGSYAEMVDQLSRMAEEIPFGPSPIIDAVDRAGTVLSLDNSTDRKSIYVFSDGDDNTDHSKLEDVSLSLSLVDTTRGVPVIAGYYNVIPAAMTLAKGRRVTNTVMDRLAEASGGNSYSVTSAGDDAKAADTAITSGSGGLGYGTFTYTIDLGEVSPIYSFTANFIVPNNTSATWQVRLAGEDKRFEDFIDNLAPNVTWYFNNRQARYLQLYAVLRSTLKLNEYGGESPLLTALNIIYHKSQTSYLYLTLAQPVAAASQVAVTFDARRPDLSTFDAGVVSSDRHDWLRYFGDSRLPLDQHGKVVIPVRSQISTTKEPLDPIDGYTFAARYGEWDFESDVEVFDAIGETVSPEKYGTFPKQGYVVFNSPPESPLYISITNKSLFKVGAKIVNRIADDPVVIKGAAWMYTTTTPLALNTPSLVEAFNLTLLPFNPTTSSTFLATYAFYDANALPEDSDRTVIKWFKIDATGVAKELTDLANHRTFDNAKENLLQAGDEVYFTVRPSNGTVYGATIRSLSVVVSSDSTVTATNLQILPHPPTPDSKFLAVYSYADANGAAESGSQIRWYKNGTLVPSLNDRTAWDNNGTPTAAVKANDTLFFTVQPSNGHIFGPLVKSSVVIISA